ncbi:MAG: pantetheine-phosphate adenylyltransferase [Myxococcota bacterium]
MKKTAIYPGSFDPITNGHIDILKRALKVFDKVILAIASNPRKNSLFTVEERIRLAKEVFKSDRRVIVDSFNGLLVDYVRKSGSNVVIRGLRAVSDFEYEFQMAHMNMKLAPEIETFFMMTGQEHFYISSQTVKEVVTFGGCVKGIVPPNVEKALIKKFRRDE